MNIPEEAIEAAAEAMHKADHHSVRGWAAAPRSARMIYMDEARTYLEAAATIIAAQVMRPVLELHKPTCEMSGGNCADKECPVRICVLCGEPYPCPTVAAIAESRGSQQ